MAKELVDYIKVKGKSKSESEKSEQTDESLNEEEEFKTAEETKKEKKSITICKNAKKLKDEKNKNASLSTRKKNKRYNSEVQLELISRIRTTLDLCEVYALFGEKMPLLNAHLSNTITDPQKEAVMMPGDEIKSFLYDSRFTLRTLIDKQTYIVKSDTEKRFWVKFEDNRIPNEAPTITMYPTVILSARHLISEKRRHIYTFCDYGCISRRFNYVLTPMYDQTLEDLRRSRVPFCQFRISTAIRLAMQTLEAIQQVHMCHFLHRDIQPKNFCIGTKFEVRRLVYIIGFEFAQNYVDIKKSKQRRGLQKLPSLDVRFQSRAFHRCITLQCFHDVESWLYMVLYFFNSHLLPWKSNVMQEREVFNRKRLFFAGHYDDQLQQYVPTSLFSMRERLSLHQDTPPFDYAFFGEAIMAMAHTFKVDWNGSFEWETSDPEVTLDPSINLYHNHKIGCQTCRKRIDKMMKREAKAYRADTALKSGTGTVDNDVYVLFSYTTFKLFGTIQKWLKHRGEELTRLKNLENSISSGSDMNVFVSGDNTKQKVNVDAEFPFVRRRNVRVRRVPVERGSYQLISHSEDSLRSESKQRQSSLSDSSHDIEDMKRLETRLTANSGSSPSSYSNSSSSSSSRSSSPPTHSSLSTPLSESTEESDSSNRKPTKKKRQFKQQYIVGNVEKIDVIVGRCVYYCRISKSANFWNDIDVDKIVIGVRLDHVSFVLVKKC